MGLASHLDRGADAECRRSRPSLAGKPLTLVLDASAAIRACLAADGFRPLRREELVAPPLMWSETLSSLREQVWRGEISADLARRALDALEDCPVRARDPRGLRSEALKLAEELGWAKTYDAEYLALARLLGCKVLTVDDRMKRGAARLELVIGPDEL